MKILHLSSEYPPQQVFGLGRFVHDLSIEQARQGHEVHVVTNSLQGREPEVVRHGVHVHRVAFPPPPKPPTSTATVTQFNIQLITRAARLIEEIGPDVLNAHDWLTALSGRVAARTGGVPLVTTIHDTVIGKQFGQLNNEHRYIARLERWISNVSHRVICCSQHVRGELTGAYGAPGDRISVIPCAVDERTFHSDVSTEHRRAFRTVLAAAEEPIVLYVGRLDPEKGLGTLATAIPEILAHQPQAKFVLAGKGGLEQELRDLIERAGVRDRCVLPGYVAGEPLSLLFSVADLLVVPSQYEPFGIVALEGMINRLPVVVADGSGLAEIVQHRVDGLRFAVGNAAELADRVCSLLADPQLRSTLAARGYQAARERFNWERVARMTEQAYSAAIEQHCDAGALAFHDPELEAAMPRPADPPTKPATEHGKTWVVAIVKGRPDLTRECLEALIENTRAPCELLVVDNGSDLATRNYLTGLLDGGRISRLLFNAPGTIVQWEKGQALVQALGLLGEESFENLAWIDNDVVVSPGWLTEALSVLDAVEHQLPVVSLCSDDKVQQRMHPTQQTIMAAGRTVRVLGTANGALWVVRRTFFERFGLPPVGEGLSQASMEDWHYSLKLREHGLGFAALDGLAEHLGGQESSREQAYSEVAR